MAASIDRSVRFSLAPVWAYACGVAAEFAPANYSNWRHVARDLAICLSLANLLFVITAERLETSYWVYVQNHPGWMSLAAFYVNVLLVGAAVWLVMLWVHRARPGVVLKAVGIVFMLLALLALKSAAHLSILPEGTTTERLLTRAGVATLLIFAFLRFERLVRYTLTTILLILSPLVPVDVILATRNILFSTPETHASAPFNLHAAVPARVLILVFDEMDQRLTFVTRPTGVRLPELDRLRSESFYASAAHAPALFTLASMPAIITGRRIKAVTVRRDDLLLTYEGAASAVPWSGEPNLFRRARRVGANTGLVGWYHPYCRVLGGDLTTCVSVEGIFPDPSRFTDNFLDQYLSVDTTFARALHLSMSMDRVYASRAYHQMHDTAIQVACDARLQLVLLHWPTPHPPGIFDRQTHQFSTAGAVNYFDNLALADQTLGELRRALEGNGLSDRTAVIVTSDHHFRVGLWRHVYGLPKELEAATGGASQPLVPFLVHFGGRYRPATYGAPFSGVLLHDLALAMLQSKICGPEELSAWLDRNRAAVPLDGEWVSDRNF